jgi:hypothetical protein
MKIGNKKVDAIAALIKNACNNVRYGRITKTRTIKIPITITRVIGILNLT